MNGPPSTTLWRQRITKSNKDQQNIKEESSKKRSIKHQKCSTKEKSKGKSFPSARMTRTQVRTTQGRKEGRKKQPRTQHRREAGREPKKEKRKEGRKEGRKFSIIFHHVQHISSYSITSYFSQKHPGCWVLV